MPKQQPSNQLGAYEEYITVTKALGENTVKAYMSDLIALEQSTHKLLVELTTEDILSFLTQYDNKRTLNRKLCAVNSFFEFCHNAAFLDDKIYFPASKVPKNLPFSLEYEQIKRSLETVDTTNALGLRDYAFILFLYGSGARVSEALALKREDIEGDWLRIRHAKGQKERIVPLALSVVAAVDAYLNERGFSHEYVWCNYQKKPLSRVSAYKITKKYLGVSPHALRHSYATALVSGGADLRVVQELLGHSSLLTTQIYTHIQKQELKETLEVFHPMNKHSACSV